MKTSKSILAAMLLGCSLSSCHHKNLIYESDLQPRIRVVFDWTKAPQANPESMALLLFDTSTGQPIRFIFDNRDGGEISVPFGNYDGLCVNGDINDWACLSHERDIDNFEISTEDATSLAAYDLASHLLPRARGTEDERLAQTPGMLWSNREDGISLPPTTKSKTITMYPAEAVCHYTVDVTDVENLQNAEGTNIDGVISGMAEGYLHGQDKPADSHVSMPFVLTVNAVGRSLHSEFLTFGESHDTAYTHKLTIYLFLTDGSKWYYTYDVTDQVHHAPDPHHVHITLSGLSLPEPMLTGGGLHPDVEEWNDVNVDIKM